MCIMFFEMGTDMCCFFFLGPWMSRVNLEASVCCRFLIALVKEISFRLFLSFFFQVFIFSMPSKVIIIVIK